MGNSDSRRVKKAIRDYEARDEVLQRDSRTNLQNTHFTILLSGAIHFPGCYSDLLWIQDATMKLLRAEFKLYRLDFEELQDNREDADPSLPSYSGPDEQKRPSWVNRKELYDVAFVREPVVEDGIERMQVDLKFGPKIYVQFMHPNSKYTYNQLLDYGKSVPGLCVVFPVNIHEHHMEKTFEMLGDNKHFFLWDRGIPPRRTRHANEFVAQIATKLAVLMKERIASENARNRLV